MTATHTESNEGEALCEGQAPTPPLRMLSRVGHRATGSQHSANCPGSDAIGPVPGPKRFQEGQCVFQTPEHIPKAGLAL